MGDGEYILIVTAWLAAIIASVGEIDTSKWHDIQVSSFKTDLENNIYVGGAHQ